jgi:hypothetical protein
LVSILSKYAKHCFYSENIEKNKDKKRKKSQNLINIFLTMLGFEPLPLLKNNVWRIWKGLKPMITQKFYEKTKKKQ